MAKQPSSFFSKWIHSNMCDQPESRRVECNQSWQINSHMQRRRDEQCPPDQLVEFTQNCSVRSGPECTEIALSPGNYAMTVLNIWQQHRRQHRCENSKDLRLKGNALKGIHFYFLAESYSFHFPIQHYQHPPIPPKKPSTISLFSESL